MDCPICKGKGKLDSRICPACRGVGEVPIVKGKEDVSKELGKTER